MLGPQRIVRLLDELFIAFDREAIAAGMIQVKTIGDGYMAVAGLPMPSPDHAEAAIRLASALLKAARQVGRRHGLDLSMRIGVATGPVLAGVIGQAKVTYDVWGDTVNLAAPARILRRARPHPSERRHPRRPRAGPCLHPADDDRPEGRRCRRDVLSLGE